MRLRQDGYRRAAQGRHEEEEHQRLECDIDNGDGTGEIDTAKDRESPTEREAVAQECAVAPRTGGRE